MVNPIIYSLEEIGFFGDKGTDRAHRAIGETINVLRETPLKISGEVIAGRSARQIIDRAKNWHADLIVLGTHQRRGLKRLLFGGTSAAVANRAHCSVRVIRGQQRFTEQRIIASPLKPIRSKNVGRVYRFEENHGWRRAA